jgi:hypothetical protein
VLYSNFFYPKPGRLYAGDWVQQSVKVENNGKQHKLMDKVKDIKVNRDAGSRIRGQESRKEGKCSLKACSRNYTPFVEHSLTVRDYRRNLQSLSNLRLKTDLCEMYWHYISAVFPLSK